MIVLATAAPVMASPDAVRVFGVTLVGISATTGVKMLFTLGLLLVVLVLHARLPVPVGGDRAADHL